jgi:hypothetical protein
MIVLSHAQPIPGLAGVLVPHALLGLLLLHRQRPVSGRLHSISMAPTEVQIYVECCGSLPCVVCADTVVQAVTLIVITTAAVSFHLCLDA